MMTLVEREPNPTPSRSVTHHQGSADDSVLSFTEEEFDARSSVEVSRHQTVKDGVPREVYYTWSVKLYFAPDESEEELVRSHVRYDAALRERFAPEPKEETECPSED